MALPQCNNNKSRNKVLTGTEKHLCGWLGVFISSFCQNYVVALQSGLIDMLVISISRCECVIPAVEDSQDACKVKLYA